MSIESSTASGFRTEIAGVPISELVERFGTPTYVYDEAKILDRVDDLRRFDVIRYAQKACSNIAILDLMRRHGVLVDAVSAGEIHRALTAGYVAGGQPPEIVYTADIFDRDAIRLVIEHDMHVNVGSPDMIDQLGEIAPGHNITLRINPGFGHGHSQKTNTGGEHSKHGIWYQQLDDCLRRADHHGLGVTGLHMHIGSGADLEHLAQVCTAMENAAMSCGPIGDLDQRRWRALDSVSTRTKRTWIWAATSNCGMPRANGSRMPSGMPCRWRSNRGGTCRPKAATWWRRFGR